MELYNDYAINPQNFEQMAKEYQNCNNPNLMSSKSVVANDDKQAELVNQLLKQVEYLRALTCDLKTRTKNKDIILVLNDIQSQIKLQSDVFANLFSIAVQSCASDNVDIKMFCNNLKLAIQSATQIVKLLIAIKDLEQTTAQQKLSITDSINQFLDINNQLVSLFGECRYLIYK